MSDVTLTVHVDVGGQAATITSQPQDPVQWVTDYFGPWWPPAPGPAPTGPTIEAAVDVDRYRQLERVAAADGHDEVLYARAPTCLVQGTAHGRLAVTPSQQVAYHRDPDGNCAVVGVDTEKVSMALARIAREAVRARLQAGGWALVHTSVVVDAHYRAVLALGAKGAGKTSVGLTLATAPGWRLLANDRAFARVTDDGAVELLPWPAAAALGLGLLDAYGFTHAVRDRLAAGEALHPTSDPTIPTAILTGDRANLREPNGRERKAQFYPGQLEDWLGLILARHGTAQAVLHPQIDLNQPPAQTPTRRRVTEDDFFHSAGTEDRYPDILGLHTAAEPLQWATVRDRLADLPQGGVRLSHDVTANRSTLTETVDQLLANT
jgi:hypothetical protein